MSGYILNREGLDLKEQKKLYRQGELELMTTHQLREICRKERIVQGIIDPLDKEELIHVIMRYRGTREQRLIFQEKENGREALEQLLEHKKITVLQDKTLHIPSKVIVYDGLTMDENDRIYIPYRRELEDTNAVLVSGGRKVCGIFYLHRKKEDQKHLYVMKSADVSCQEADWKDYDLYCFGQQDSDRIFSIYYGMNDERPESITAYRIPLMDVEVRESIALRMPLVIDFGSTNTTAGVYLDSLYFENAKGALFAEAFEKNAIQYTIFEDGKKLMPSVVGVISVMHGEAQFVFGQAAVDLSNACYVDEGFSIFYDMKRWISDYEKEEEITDREGRRTFLARKEIIRAYFEHIIRVTENQFKCKVKQIQVSCPVKQKFLFQKLFREILPEYIMKEEEMIDEGVAVLYNTISTMLESGNVETDRTYQALIVDCGGGTTDLCACHFRVRDDSVAYHIRIDTAYENGDTDFGGNNLTYRIMQYLKILLVEHLAGQHGFQLAVPSQAILRELDMDIFRYVDTNGTEQLYQTLEEAYESAERWIPTRFKEYEARSREEYFKVKNNFYLLFFLAEQVKKQFYEQAGILRVGITSAEKEKSDIIWIQADKWKLSVQEEKGFQIVKEFPEVILNLYELELILKGDIYAIIRKFMEPMYLEDKIRYFSFLKLTGQSCKIDIFREALKEFIPGRMIQFKRKNRETAGDIDLKMSCVDGALKFMRDKRLGYAQIELHSDKPVLPYTVSAFTHNGKEVELVNGFLRKEETRYVSRNLEDVTLQLYLKDTEGQVRYHFYFDCEPERFEEVTYEEIQKVHGNNIPQKETDSIVNQEIRFFAWKRCRDWGYVIVPVYRKAEKLYLGAEQFYPFEHEGWVMNYFDGMK
ncbi:MAG: molecular chaperone [Lachnospiraceae bacterium]|nr:molecular chaperone [Lachnospiraceae bacterium]